HLADGTPGFRKDNYRESILRKLHWQGEFARLFNANRMVRVGDFFHVKAANKTTMATLAAAAGLHRRYPCPTMAIAGNHDMSQNDPETVSRQPLGVFFKAGVFQHFTDEVLVSGSMSVRVVGVEYTTDLDDDALRDMVRKKDNHTYTIAYVHALAAFAPEERIQSFFNERVFDYRDLVFDGCPDVYVFGHYHKDQGIREHLGVKFVNLGAISRGALTFENLERVPKVSSIVCNSQGISVEEHAIPCGDPAHVFDLEKKKTEEKARRSIEDFITKFRSERRVQSGSAVQDRMNEFMNSDYPDDLKKLMLETLRSASENGAHVE
ncbi:MAG TPA: metallophosphoesterase, partial [Methylobacter sp.]